MSKEEEEIESLAMSKGEGERRKRMKAWPCPKESRRESTE
jgi:hypothetical protein